MKKINTLGRNPFARWIVGILLALSTLGIAYAAKSDWIFCDSFESPGTSCSVGVGPIHNVEGRIGNLWDQMHWEEGTWH